MNNNEDANPSEPAVVFVRSNITGNFIMPVTIGYTLDSYCLRKVVVRHQ